ncbi:5-oxoprolinase subunit PxpA [Basilea psittacipulmonis]|uniref:LamB/YcsF family protein n=1 Tax=Basilea psittacipulmonis DSM 24701 TaxID=1072685 RepID=A0A077DBU8_9BURK|nr:5-oxoprolinase subunit PxpA [Basilea psittacipulmonis]AIL32134.1 LamB/YcsF family protein [Basilea psittacipulmonis DSM 24701]
MKRIDINCDMGESYGNWTMGNDEAIMPYIDSANIACGFHAGDFSTMFKTVKLALKHHVNIGAHVGFDDKQGFGRREIKMSAQEIYELTVYQIGAMNAIVKACDPHASIHHLKPHGALYNMSANHHDFSQAIVQAIKDCQPNMILYSLAGSLQVKMAKASGLTVYEEAFSDRTYTDQGTLTPRSEPNAVIHDSHLAIEHIKNIIKGNVMGTSGKMIPLHADTICIHGDGKQAVAFAQQLKASIAQL